ncbi:hypothetical protein KDA_42060 [Dictyobacter alpinus]|uniref:Uncharacterized protein n=1 Tax=Dictyobacter alpinus TaxID=2014873 RepID=A0A402BBP3_9CHLR|nr:putative glycolipid-binding domain-containing protein [Dictyobacter alpinus]GCE28722.1 hypothetical protein KDA_42060 [Dictyobacter alpinus]
MGTQLQAESKMPLHMYESAAHANVGRPLEKLVSRSAQILCILGAIISLLLFAWLCYSLFAALSFGVLAQTYHTSAEVPADQLQNYRWLQNLHDNFWLNMPGIIIPLGASLILFGRFYLAARTQLYICSEGLLTIYRKKEEAIRWDDVREFYLLNGSVTQLVRTNKTRLLLPFSILGASNKAGDQAIIAELMPRLLPPALASYERGEVVSFRDLQISQQGISFLGELVSWDNLGAVAWENNELSAYYAKEESLDGELNRQWYVWQTKEHNSNTTLLSLPNLLVFVALVNEILDRQHEHKDNPPTPQPLTDAKESVENNSSNTGGNAMETHIMWNFLAGPGMEHLQLVEDEGGIVADGLIIGIEQDIRFRLWYRLQIDQDWHIREYSLQVSGEQSQAAYLLSDGQGHWTDADGNAYPDLDGCLDIDIAHTPFTNTLPIRRLELAVGESMEIQVAYITVPDLNVRPARQRYTCLTRTESGGSYRYESLDSDFTAELTVDEQGLVIDYPELWQMV